MVDAALKDRDAGEGRFVDRVQDLFPGVVDIDADNIHAGCHDLRSGDIREIDRGADQLGGVLIQDILIFRDIDHGMQLLERSFTVLLHHIGQKAGDQADQADNDKGDRF